MSSNQEQTEILREILKWIRFTGIREVKSVLETVLTTDQKKMAYQLSDGTLSSREIARMAGYGSKTTVADLWESWRRLGIGESLPAMGGGTRFKGSFDLEDFGFKISKTPGIQASADPAEEKESRNA